MLCVLYWRVTDNVTWMLVWFTGNVIGASLSGTACPENREGNPLKGNYL